MRALPILVVASLLSIAPAFALEDSGSGLAVNLPADYIAETTNAQRPYDVAIGVKFATGAPSALAEEPYLCQVTFDAVPGNAGLTRETINAQIGSPEWIAMARAGMEPILVVDTDAGFELAGYKGHEFIGTPKQSGGEDVRLVLSMVETAKGRTAISCVTEAARLDELMDDFHAIRDGVTPPQ